MANSNGYSRLSWAEERRLRRRTIFLGALSTLLLIAFLVWGLPGIPTMLATVRELGSSTKPTSKTDTIAPPPPSLFPLPLATNSATLIVSGSAEPESSVEISLNGTPQPLVTTSKKGVFQSVKLTLTEGSNSIKALAIDQASNRSAASQELKITFDRSTPTITLDQPQEGQKFVGSKQQRLSVSGQINKPVSLTLNQRYLVVSSDGTFSGFLTLSNGDNLLTFIATDSAGNTTTKEIKVTFEP